MVCQAAEVNIPERSCTGCCSLASCAQMHDDSRAEVRMPPLTQSHCQVNASTTARRNRCCSLSWRYRDCAKSESEIPALRREKKSSVGGVGCDWLSSCCLFRRAYRGRRSARSEARRVIPRLLPNVLIGKGQPPLNGISFNPRFFMRNWKLSNVPDSSNTL
jgi:hypothetical protein